jgi:cytochrome c553
MTPLAEKLTDADMADLAAFYEAQAARRRPASLDPARIAAGRQLAETHHCASCHRPDLSGQQQAARLGGQDFDYLLRLLRGFKAKTAADLDGTMTVASQPLSPEDILDLVHFMASLDPQGSPR